ncbi:MAG: alpha/beta hydrolase fold domain-containing protein [Eggerthellaceae bacterium]
MHEYPEYIGPEWVGEEIDPTQFPRALFDISYASASESEKLDIYLPPKGDGPFPFIFYIPGGGWKSGGKRGSSHANVLKALWRGYALVIIDYRYSTEGHWPLQLFDAKAALRFVRAHASEYHLDPDHVAAWGNSAGGHIANMLTATGSTHILEDPSMGNANQSCAIQALVSWYSPIDLAAMDLTSTLGDGPHPLGPVRPHRHAYPAEEGLLPTPEACVLGFVPRKFAAVAAMSNPMEFVTPAFPPALYQNGSADEVVPWTQASGMVRHINDICGDERARCEILPGPHGAPSIKSEANVNRCIDFIDEVFYGEPRPHGALPEIVIR